MRRLAPALMLAACVAVVSGTAVGKDTKKKPYPGVKVIEREVTTEEGLIRKFHAAIIDLTIKGTQVVVSPPKYKGYRTSKFAKEFGAQVALNGGFWKLVSKKPIGHVVSAGRPWKDCFLDERYGFLAITREGKAWIQPPGEYKLPPADEGYMVISGSPLLVDEGKVGKVRGCGYVCMAHPRSAVGVSEDGDKIILAVTEGRMDGYEDMKPVWMAEFLIEMGAWQALNMDGGGLSSLYVEKLGGMLNAPAEGKERSVINHIGIVLGADEETLEAPAEQHAEPTDGSTEPDVAEPAEATTAAIEFDEDDFVPVGDVENPPRVRQAITAGLVALAGLAIGVVVVVLIARRRRGRSTGHGRT